MRINGSNQLLITRGGIGSPTRVKSKKSKTSTRSLRLASNKAVKLKKLKREISFNDLGDLWNPVDGSKNREAFWEQAEAGKLDYYFTTEGLSELEKVGARQEIVDFLLKEKGAKGREVLKQVADREIEREFKKATTGFKPFVWLNKKATGVVFRQIKAQGGTFEQAMEYYGSRSKVLDRVLVEKDALGTILYIQTEVLKKTFKDIWDSV